MSTCKFKTVKSDWFDLIYIVLYQIILFIVDSISFGGFELGYEVLDASDVDAKISECRYYEDSIMYVRNEI